MLTINVLEKKGQHQEEAADCATIANVFQQHLTHLGFVDGRWDLDIIRKKTSKNLIKTNHHKQLEYKHRDSNKLYYQIQPTLESDISWRVAMQTPPFVDPNQVVAAEKDFAEKGVLIVETISKEIKISVGQKHKATVTGHLDYGLKIKIGESEGIIHLADISETYDKNDLLRYPVGKVVPVIISSIDEKKNQIVCSTKIDVDATHANDLFTGIPNKDGSLSLLGYTKDINRKSEIIEHLFILCTDHPSNVIKHEAAIAHLDTFFKEKYGAVIDKRSVTTILTGICSGDFAWLAKIEDGYALTELGLETIEGSKPTPPTRQTPEPPQPDLPPPPPSPSPSQPSPSPPVEPVTSQIIQESGTYTQLPEQPEPESPKKPEPKKLSEDLKKIQATDLDEIARYFGKIARLQAITQNIDALTTEHDEIKKWLDMNKHLHIIAERLFQKMMCEED